MVKICLKNNQFAVCFAQKKSNIAQNKNLSNFFKNLSKKNNKNCPDTESSQWRTRDFSQLIKS